MHKYAEYFQWFFSILLTIAGVNDVMCPVKQSQACLGDCQIIDVFYVACSAHILRQQSVSGAQCCESSDAFALLVNAALDAKTSLIHVVCRNPAWTSHQTRLQLISDSNKTHTRHLHLVAHPFVPAARQGPERVSSGGVHPCSFSLGLKRMWLKFGYWDSCVSYQVCKFNSALWV